MSTKNFERIPSAGKLTKNQKERKTSLSIWRRVRVLYNTAPGAFDFPKNNAWPMHFCESIDGLATENRRIAKPRKLQMKPST